MRTFPFLAAVLLLASCEPTQAPQKSGAQVAPVVPAAQPAAAPVVNSGIKHWSAPPPMTIDPAKSYQAVWTLKKGGRFTTKLHAKEAPIAVNSFVFLARQGFYDGLSFHRVIDGFMAQGGDPTGTGMGGPGYAFKNESSTLRFDHAGVLAMANAGRDTNGSQFFITFDAAPHLDGGFTIFGQVTEGMEVVNGITRRDPDSSAGTAADLIDTLRIEEK